MRASYVGIFHVFNENDDLTLKMCMDRIVVPDRDACFDDSKGAEHVVWVDKGQSFTFLTKFNNVTAIANKGLN